jgi:hypothetical protein
LWLPGIKEETRFLHIEILRDAALAQKPGFSFKMGRHKAYPYSWRIRAVAALVADHIAWLENTFYLYTGSDY